MQKFIVAVTAVLLAWFSHSTFAQATRTCQKQALQTGASTQTITVNQLPRTYIQYIPSTDGTHALPIVFSFHGYASDAIEQEQRTDFDAIAERESFIAIYPQGLGEPPSWYNGISFLNPDDKPVDVDFFNALLDHLETTYCVDSTRVFVTGFSMGGGMAYRLGCQVSDRITAIGTVSGLYAEIPDGGCQPARPMPVLTIHGQSDPIVRYQGMGILLPKISDWVDAWANRDACQTTVDLPSQGAINGVLHTDCADDVQVIFYTITDGGHTWAGSPLRKVSEGLGKLSLDINASETLWAFFTQFQLK